MGALGPAAHNPTGAPAPFWHPPPPSSPPTPPHPHTPCQPLCFQQSALAWPEATGTPMLSSDPRCLALLDRAVYREGLTLRAAMAWEFPPICPSWALVPSPFSGGSEIRSIACSSSIGRCPRWLGPVREGSFTPFLRLTSPPCTEDHWLLPATPSLAADLWATPPPPCTLSWKSPPSSTPVPYHPLHPHNPAQPSPGTLPRVPPTTLHTAVFPGRLPWPPQAI